LTRTYVNTGAALKYNLVSEISCRITANDMQILHSARRAEQNAMFREWERLVAWVVGASLLMVNVI
jgi:hypothetical protein